MTNPASKRQYYRRFLLLTNATVPEVMTVIPIMDAGIVISGIGGDGKEANGKAEIFSLVLLYRK